MPEPNGTTNVREELANLALSDAVSSNRMNDAIREALMTSLFKKSDDMSANEIIEAIKTLESTSGIEKTEKILTLMDK